MNRILKRNLVFVGIIAIFLFLAVSVSYAYPEEPGECGGCHTINPSYTMVSNSTGNATLGMPFTLMINASKGSGTTDFYLALKTGWADNDRFNFTPAVIKDNTDLEDLDDTALIISHAFTFIPETVGNWTIRAWCATKQFSKSLDIPINVTELPDEIPPTLDSPSDIEYEVYSTGHSISWTPYDENPISFSVKANGVTILSGGWNGQPIVVNVDYLIPGTYVYTCTVFDKGGNNATDSVNVTVTGEVITTTTETSTTTVPPSSSSTTSTTSTTSSGGGQGVPSDDDEVLTTATFSFIMLSTGIIVGVLVFLLILDKWRPWN